VTYQARAQSPEYKTPIPIAHTFVWNISVFHIREAMIFLGLPTD